MEGIKIVIDFVIRLMNTSLTFGAFTFTIGQSWLALAALAIVIYFVVNLFDL